jgi:hypothetical protein
MRQKVFFSILIASFFLLTPKSYCQRITFSDSTNHWQVVEHYTATTHTNTTYFDCNYIGSTIINGKPYKLIKSTYGDSAYIREDTTNNIVYYFNFNINAESMLYNFNLKHRDTMIYTISGNTIIDTATFIDSILIDGIKYKKINFECANCGNYYFFRLYSIIQGIGCLSGPIFPLSNGACQDAGSYDYELNCFSENGNSPQYTIPFANNCAYIPSISNINTCFPLEINIQPFSEINIEIKPNPFSQFIQIALSNHYENIKSIKIQNVYGDNLYFIDKLSTTFIQINTSEFPNGIYIVEVINNNYAKKYVQLIKYNL